MPSKSSTQNIILNSLRGGMNDEDPPNALQEDETVLAENVEYVFSTIGERRSGCELLDITGSGLELESVVVHIAQFFPDNDITNPEVFAIAATPDISVTVARRSNGVWSQITPVDPIDPSAPDIYNIRSQMLHGKLFFAYKSDEDRLHVWDGSSLRRTGLAEPPAAPTGANEGVGTFTGTRYYRVRYVVKDGDDVLLRSEPSEVLTFAPSGTGAGVTVTRPALINEGETHWELEASDDGAEADFYRIATTVVGTTTFNDETVLDGYPDVGPLSEDIGDYLLIPSAKFLAADEDRLLFGSHWTDETLNSQVGWSPVANDTGSGNDERLPLSVDNTLVLNSYEGGGLTGISQLANGSWYAFKWGHIYQLVRTGDAIDPYEAVTISKARGSLPGSIVSGTDEGGQGCIYFIDPIVGPSRLSRSGLQRIAGILGTFSRINLTATDVISHGVFYPNKTQVHWWISTEGANRPNKKMVLHTDLLREMNGEASGGWVIATGRIGSAVCSAIVNELLADGDLITLVERPVIGVDSIDCILRCDAGEDDAGVGYRAIIRSRPYFVAGLLNKWGGMNAALFATSHNTAFVQVKFIKDFGREEKAVETDLLPKNDEEFVVKFFDNLEMSEAISIQFEFSDPEE